MRQLAAMVLMVSLGSSLARADESKLALTFDPVEAQEAKSDRAVGIGLFGGGLAVLLAGQALSGVGIAATFADHPTADDSQRAQNLAVGGALTVAAGAAMWIAGLALWSKANHRRARLASGAIYF